MNKIKRMLKRWLGINYLIDLCDERDICVNKRITQEQERYNKLFITNERNLANAVKTYDKMLDDINDKMLDVQQVLNDKMLDVIAKLRNNIDSNGYNRIEAIVNDKIDKVNDRLDVNRVFERLNKLEAIVNNDIGNNEEDKKNKHFKQCLILKIEALLKHINLHYKGGCDND